MLFASMLPFFLLAVWTRWKRSHLSRKNQILKTSDSKKMELGIASKFLYDIKRII